MAIEITPEIQLKLERFQKSLFTIQSIQSAFSSASPSVDAEPYQDLFEDSVERMLRRFDELCTLLGLPN